MKRARKTINTLLATALITTGLMTGASTADAASGQTFKDVSKKHWAYSAVENVAAKKLVAGYADGTYRPNGQVTRAELAAFLARAFDGKERGSEPFVDVASNHWAVDAINEGIALGFIKPSDYKNNKFEPNKAMTRSEIARWLANGLVASNEEYEDAIKELANSSLTVIPIPEFYKGGVNKTDLPYIGVALGTGLLSGYTDFTFKPNGNTTRAEIATILIRFLDVKEKDATSFTGLEELREVANTGTNILTITDFEKVDSPYASEYKDVLGKPHTYLNKTGVATIEHAIFIDTTGSTAKGIFKDMFFDPTRSTASLNRNAYEIYYEYTLVPSRDVSFQSIRNGSDRQFAAGMLIKDTKVEQFGMSVPKSLEKNDFKQGVKYKYWANNTILKTSVLNGRTDDDTQFLYKVSSK